MKILVVNYEYPPLGGGGGVISSQVATALAQRHSVDVVTTHYKGLPRCEVRNGVHIHRVPVLGRRQLAAASLPSLLTYFPASLLTGLRLCGRKRYDIVHTHFAVPSGPSGALLSRALGIPNVLSIYGGDIYDPSKALSPHKIPLLKSVVEALLKQASMVVAESSDIREKALTHYNLGRDVAVFPLGIEVPPFVATSRASLGLSEDEFVVVTVGRQVARKGFAYLLQAIARLAAPGLRLVLVGQGPQRDDLISLAAALGISSQVTFVGAVSEEKKYQLLSASDLFVLPSLHEGFGLVFLEAMTCGLPIVATDTGGQKDFLVEGRNGFLVPPRDSEALADRIGELHRDAETRKSMGANNRVDVGQFTAGNTAARYEDLFTSLIGARRTAVSPG